MLLSFTLLTSQSKLEAQVFHLQAASVPRAFVESGKPNLILEASAVESINEGAQFLVAHDKHPALYVIDSKTGKIVGEPINSPKFPAASKTGPKWEGMARDSQGNYYLIGAHNGKTEEERATKSDLIRFRLKESGSPSIDDASVVRWTIGHSLVKVLKSAGLTDDQIAKRKIEGLTVREVTGKDGKQATHLAIGLREPGDKVRGFVADITSAAPDTELDLKPLFAFKAEDREGVSSNLTSLEYAPSLGGFLVITATEDEDNVFHGNTLWFVADGESQKAKKIKVFEVAMKAEGLAILGTSKNPAGGKVVKLLITFDNDPHSTKIPSRFLTANLVQDAQ
jgi:hypothetical protein